jgi:DNA-binding beta-propeller fold protein YncE
MTRKSQFSVLFGTILLSLFAFSQFSYADLSFSDEFGSSGTGDDEFKKPADLAISKDGTNLYVVDGDNNRIKIFELTGGNNCPNNTEEVVSDEVCFDDDFGSSGSGDGKFDAPTNLAINLGNGDIYVIDSDNNRIQRLSKRQL